MRILHQQKHERLLRVQPVLRLIIHHGLGRIDNLVRNLLAAVSRKAVHKQGPGVSNRHQVLGHTVRRKDLVPQVRGEFLAHAGPNIRIDRVCPRHRLNRIMESLDGRAGLSREGARRFQHLRLGFVTRRRRDANRRSELCSQNHQRVAHVVAVADEGQLQSLAGRQIFRAG